LFNLGFHFDDYVVIDERVQNGFIENMVFVGVYFDPCR